MYYLAIAAGIYFFRARIARLLEPAVARLAPFLPALTPQKSVLYGHSCTLAGALVFVLPLEFVGLSGIKNRAFLFSLWSAVITSVLTIKANYGAPDMPQNLSFSNWREACSTTIQPWLQKAMMGVDFHFLFFSLIFLTSIPSIWPIGILGRRSLWAVSSHYEKEESGPRLWQLFAPVWAKLKARQKEVLHGSAVAEILLAFWLTANLLLPTRQIFTCILYWNYLRTRYQVPRSHEQHAQAWRQLGDRVQPVLKVAPILNKPIDIAKGWFQPKYG